MDDAGGGGRELALRVEDVGFDTRGVGEEGGDEAARGTLALGAGVDDDTKAGGSSDAEDGSLRGAAEAVMGAGFAADGNDARGERGAGAGALARSGGAAAEGALGAEAGAAAEAAADAGALLGAA